MEVNTTLADNYCLLKITGRLDSYTTPQLKTSIQNIEFKGIKLIIVDLSEIDYISSSGLLALVHSQKNLLAQDIGEIYIAGAPEVVLNSFAIAGFDEIFTFFTNVQSAIDSIEVGN